MEFWIIILGLFLVFCFSIFLNIKLGIKNSKLKKKKLEEYSDKWQSKIDNLQKQNELNLDLENKKFQEELAKLKTEQSAEIIELTQSSKQQMAIIEENIKSNKDILKHQEEEKQNYINQGQEIIKQEIEKFKVEQTKELEKQKEQALGQIQLEAEQKKNQLEKDFEIKQKEILDNITNLDGIYNERKELLEKEYKYILEELEDYRSRRAAINEAIRREEELQNELDFHRIILSNNNKEDIGYLLSIEDKINNKALLRKLIWSEYLQKPFNKMINNLFGSSIPKNVIYCIENIENHKKYIGKTSALVSKRWTEHIKTSLNIGTAKRSYIHDNLFNNWDNFTFSIIEIVDKEELSEKEKYYIKFFETDKYGYNMNSGG